MPRPWEQEHCRRPFSAGHKVKRRPLVFIAMPFGVKFASDVADKVDFDRIYELALKPALAAFDVDYVRADEEPAGGIIHAKMFERLLFADLAIVDVTLDNANVFYELGIRHCARRRATIIIRAEGGQIPFDIAMTRIVPYKLTRGVLTDEEATRLRDELARRINYCFGEMEQLDGKDSPLFQLMDGFSGVNTATRLDDSMHERLRSGENIRARIAGIADRLIDPSALDELDAVASELDTASPESLDVLMALLDAYQRQQGFSRIIMLVERLPSELRVRPSVQGRYVLAVCRSESAELAELALSEMESTVDRSIATAEECARVFSAYQRLLDHPVRSSYADGMAKLDIRRLSDRAIRWGRRAFELDPHDYYTGLNLAERLLKHGTAEAYREGKAVAGATLYALLRLERIETAVAWNQDYWYQATLLQLNVMLENWTFVDDLVDRIRSLKETVSWELEATRLNIAEMRDLLATPEGRARAGIVIDKLF